MNTLDLAGHQDDELHFQATGDPQLNRLICHWNPGLGGGIPPRNIQDSILQTNILHEKSSSPNPPISTHKAVKLVGGFNPFEKY